ncbi:RNA polymerase sigma factor [Candidatus Foliamicus sp.]
MSGFANRTIDPAFVRSAQRGDMKAHEIIFRQFSDPIYTLALRMTGSPPAAEDILQETFVEVLRGIAKFRGEASLATWIRRIAVSRCLMHLRAAWTRRRQLFSEIVGNEGTYEITAARETPELAIDIEAALDSLPPTARAVVWLHDVEGFTHAEIASMMSKTPSFSKSQLARARKRLKERLAPAPELDDTPVRRAANA